jgi:Spy/CpxP family protein refolding chaperone
VSIGKVILVVLATVVIFSTGLLTGVVLVRQMAPRSTPPPPRFAGPRWQQFMYQAQGELELTPEQHQRLTTILRESQERARTLAGGEFRKVREQIQAELSPAQKEKFERLLKERQRQMRETMAPGLRSGPWPNRQMTTNGDPLKPGQRQNTSTAPSPAGTEP